VLAETGHAQLAAEAAGVSVDCVYRLRRVEAGFAALMDAARDAADRRFAAGRREAEVGARDVGWAERGSAGRPSPRPSPAGGRGGAAAADDEAEGWDPDVPAEVKEGLFVILRGSGGRLRMAAAGRRFWTDRHDAIFLGHLRATGNAAFAARATGFTPKTAQNRRKRLASFARAWERELAEAEARLEARVLADAMRWTPAMYPGAFEAGEPERLDPWLALHFLKWRERRRRAAMEAERRGAGRGPQHGGGESAR
jgi:hypothetical protein